MNLFPAEDMFLQFAVIIHWTKLRAVSCYWYILVFIIAWNIKGIIYNAEIK